MDHDDAKRARREAWKLIITALREKQQEAKAMGGEARLESRHSAGKLNARQRITVLLDPDSFSEIGELVGSITSEGEPATPADGFVAGSGTINGRPVFVGVEDFTVMGGSIGIGGGSKRYRLAQLAAQERVPLIMLLEGAGHRMTNAIKKNGRSPNDLQGLAELSGIVPTVCLVLGPSAGHGALTAPLSDFVVMHEDAALFSAGPPLVTAAIGERTDKTKLGGPDVHVRQSGVAHNCAPTETHAIAMARRYLDFFPSNAWQWPPMDDAETGYRSLDSIIDIIPPESTIAYDIRPVLELMVDENSLFEVQPAYGASIVTALAFLGGESVAIIANNPAVNSGTINSNAAEKAAHFIQVAGAFHLPVVFLADNPGVMAGTRAEQDGILRAAARMFAAQHRLRSVKISVTLRKAFGFGSSVMAVNPFDGQSACFAFPGVTMAAMPAASGGAAANLNEEAQQEVDHSQSSGPYKTANSLGFDAIIEPAELRNVLIKTLKTSTARKENAPSPVSYTGIIP